MKLPRFSYQSLRILSLLLSHPSIPFSGAQIIREVHSSGGTVYPILCRLATSKLISGRWEKGSPKNLGHPRRRFYSLTPKGKRIAHSVLGYLQVWPTR